MSDFVANGSVLTLLARDTLNIIAWYIEPDPVKFRYDGDVRIFFDACRPVVNMSMVCTTLAASMTPLITKSYHDPITNLMRFSVTSKGKRVECIATFWDLQNPYSHQGTKKRMIESLLVRIRHIFGAPTLMSFKEVELPDATFNELVKEECAYRKGGLQTNTERKIKPKQIRQQILTEAQNLGGLSKFINLEKTCKDGRKLVWRVCAAMATKVYITDSNHDATLMRFWEYAPRLVRRSMFRFSGLLTPEIPRETNVATFREHLMHQFVTSSNLCTLCEYRATEKLRVEIQELACRVYRDESNKNIHDMLKAMDKMCYDRGIWVDWIDWV